MNKCVVCESETKGSYDRRFPVCIDCYERGYLIIVFRQLVHRETMKLNPTLNIFIEQVMDSAEKWYENYQELI